jgi:predicted protein tyrosine phosphatase
MHAHLNANKQNKVLVHCMAGISRSKSLQKDVVVNDSLFLSFP